MRNADSRFAESSHHAGVAAHRRLLAGLGAFLLAAILLVFGASRASAVLLYPNVATFGSDGTSATSIGSVRQIAFDQAANRLYVLGSSPPRIYGFDASTPGTYTPLAGAFPLSVESTGSDRLSDIAVDQSGFATNGNIIYATTEGNKIYSFNSAGALQAGFPIELDSPGSDFLTGAGVDSSGNIWAGNYYPQRFEKFSSAGAFLGSVSAVGDSYPYPGHAAFDSVDNMYATHYYGSGDTSKYAVAGGYTSRTQLDSQGAVDVEVDRTSGKIYPLRPDSLAIYSSGGTLERTIATGISSNFYGVAIDEATDAIFISDGNAGKVRVFAPVNAPVPTTEGTSNMLRNSVTIGGNANPDGAGNITECYFEWGLAPGYGQTKPCADTLPITSAEGVTADLTGLTTDTTYNYRLVLGNANANSKNVGANMTVKTPSAVAGVTAEAASDQTQTTAQLNGTFTGDGLNTKYWFEWGPTTAYTEGKVSAGPDTSAVGPVTVSAGIGGLSVHLPSSLPYHYRLVAENITGKTLGPDKTFFAAPPDLPAISGTAADEVTSTGARLKGSIDPGNGPTIYVFEYGPTDSYGSTTPVSPSIGDDSVDHPVDETITGLAPGTVYHFRLVASNFTGTTHSADQTFVAPGLAKIESNSASSVTQSSARLSALVIPNGSPTEVSFEYGTTTAYGQSTGSKPIGADLFLVDSSSDLTGLSPGTTYHFRAVAVNGVGTAPGSDQAFTTSSVPKVTRPGEVKKCKKPKVKRHGKCVKKKKKKNPRGNRSNG